jgi:hypothetical protein
MPNDSNIAVAYTNAKEDGMSLAHELLTLKGEILERVKTAAQESDVTALTRFSRAAEECETLIKQEADLHCRVRDLTGSLLPNSGTSPIAAVNSYGPKIRSSPKREGADIRDTWVKMLSSKGVRLYGHAKKYHTQHGISVAVASANEPDNPQRKNKWFLGLKDEPTDVAVLLCRDLKQEVYDFVLPVTELGVAWKVLSRSGGQIKFNVRKEAGEFLLAVPGNRSIVVTKYFGNYSPLNGPAP